ncbi:MAG TPA: sugar-binding protein, partial [Gemmatimonadaceae bacterium]|nr:sugar-binding protein [Gemmatimonadaceae bacterium]
MKLTLALVLAFPCIAVAQGTTSVASRNPAPSYPATSPASLGSATASAALAMRAASAPTLDGKLDDEVWKNAQTIDKFLEYEPKQGAETRFKTDVRVVHDEKYLYIMARMFDPAPDSIISLLSRRDVRTQSEQLKLVIDSYHDRRTAY